MLILNTSIKKIKTPVAVSLYGIWYAHICQISNQLEKLRWCESKGVINH